MTRKKLDVKRNVIDNIKTAVNVLVFYAHKKHGREYK